MKTSIIGLNIVKNVFHMYSIGDKNKLIKKKLKRAELLSFFANYPESDVSTLFRTNI